jgi:hypothetical protein
MAWNDHFEPDFCDPDSLSYVETSPFLPTDSNFNLIDCTIECSNILWDFRNTHQVARQLGKYERLRSFAVRIDQDDSLWESYI